MFWKQCIHLWREPQVDRAIVAGRRFISNNAGVLCLAICCYFPLVAQAQSGKVAAWGWNPVGQTNVPNTLSNVVAISGGAEHSLALTAAGTIIGWGSSSFGKATAPYGVTNVVAVSAGGQFSLALMADSTVRAWGDNSNDQTRVPAGISNVVAISAGDYHSLALKADGTVVAWGNNANGKTNVPPGLSNVVAIAAGDSHSLALRANGTLAAWGFSGYGRTTIPSDLTNAIGISCGYAHNLVLKADGKVAAWGNNDYGQTTVPAAATNIIFVEAGRNHSMALSADGRVFAWGHNSYKQSNIPATVTNAVAICAGDWHSLAILGGAPVIAIQPSSVATYSGKTAELKVRALGSLPLSYQWHFNGAPDADATNDFLKIQNLTPDNGGDYFVVVSNRFGSITSSIASITAPHFAPLILDQPESVLTYLGGSAILRAETDGSYPISRRWQRNGIDVEGGTNDVLGLTNVSIDAAGEYSMIASNEFGTVTTTNVLLHVNNVVAWGHQSGVTNCPAGLSNIVSIASGKDHQLALRRDGQIIAWGLNAYGQNNVPAHLTNAIAVAAGFDHSLGLRQDGTVVAWGRNQAGQTNVPPGLTNVVSIAAGGTHSVAVKADGRLVAWGSLAQTSIPPEATDIVAIATGFTTVALRADGKVVAWPSTNDLSGLTNVVAVAVGGFSAAGSHSVALRRDGTVFAWGYNSFGQVPAGLSNVVAMAAGFRHALALIADGTVTGWGDYSGYNYAIPPGLKNIDAIAAGDEHNLALIGDGTPVVTTLPSNVTSFSGKTLTLNGKIASQTSCTFQWWYNGVPIAEATNSFLNLNALAAAASGTYELVVCNEAGCVTNRTMLTVTDSSPVIVRQPASQISHRTGSGLFRVSADGSSPLSYQWFFNGSPLPGATESTLSVNDLVPEDSGEYSATVYNSFGTKLTDPVRLFVNDVVAWGTNQIGQTNVPPGLTNIVSISCGGYHTLALRADGRVLAWGDDRVVKGAAYGGTNMPLPYSNIVSIAGGGFHSLLLEDTGKVIAIGSNTHGQTNVPASLSNVVAIAAGMFHSMALDSHGKVTVWGNNAGGLTNVPESVTNVVAIASGQNHVLALSSNGKVASWGANSYGRTNVPLTLSNVVGVAAGETHSVAIDSQGRVHVWGSISYGGAPLSATNVVMVASGANQNLALRRDGTIVDWSQAMHGSALIPTLQDVFSISAGYEHVVALIGDGNVSPQISKAIFTNNEVTLRWTSIPNRRYRVQTSYGLEGNWTNILNEVFANQNLSSATVQLHGESHQFFRVLLIEP